MEAVLGRPAFHRVFTYMRRLAAVRDPGLLSAAAVGGLAVGGSYGSYGDARDGEGGMDADGAAAGVLEYFTRRADDPAAVKQVRRALAVRGVRRMRCVARVALGSWHKWQPDV